jgi:hypothetical protein
MKIITYPCIVVFFCCFYKYTILLFLFPSCYNSIFFCFLFFGLQAAQEEKLYKLISSILKCILLVDEEKKNVFLVRIKKRHGKRKKKTLKLIWWIAKTEVLKNKMWKITRHKKKRWENKYFFDLQFLQLYIIFVLRQSF